VTKPAVPPRWGARRSAPPRDALEKIELVCEDGRALRGVLRRPPRGTKPNGVIVFAHGAFARKAVFEPEHGDGLARLFSSYGYRTFAFDFRGHGDSRPTAAEGGRWSYDDLVRHDLPTAVAFARSQARGGPVVVFGHALGGHAALASQATERLFADAVVAFAADVWLRRFDANTVRWLAKKALVGGLSRLCDARGFFPARDLGFGSDDEAAACVRALVRFSREDAWMSDDGEDYLAALARVAIPIVSVTTDRDALSAPECAARFLSGVAGRRESLVLPASIADLLEAPLRAAPHWERVGRALADVLTRPTLAPPPG
jgi:predicted alpha/beta hydrolase